MFTWSLMLALLMSDTDAVLGVASPPVDTGAGPRGQALGSVRRSRVRWSRRRR